MIISKKYQDKSLLLYQGALTVNLISILGNHIRLFLNHETKPLQLIFKVFIELAQNVSYYSVETLQVKSGVYCGVGWVSVQEFIDHYRVSTGNQIKTDDGPKLLNYCNEINSFDEEQLRKLKRDTRSQAMVRDIGAHIGLIQSCIISGNKLIFTISEEDQSNHFFTISARIDK